jgi:hypothetical protein
VLLKNKEFNQHLAGLALVSQQILLENRSLGKEFRERLFRLIHIRDNTANRVNCLLAKFQSL